MTTITKKRYLQVLNQNLSLNSNSWFDDSDDDIPDEELAAKLRYLADGEFCVVFEGRSKHWLNSPEYYRKTLNWQMDQYVADDSTRRYRLADR